MSGPVTRPLVFDDPPHTLAELRATNSSSISSRVENNVNKPMPWLVLVGIISGIALGLAIGARDDALEAKRIAERETRLQRLEVDELKVALKMQGIETHEGSKP